MRFAAIDFETANHHAGSACAVGLVIVDEGRFVDRTYHLIRPPGPAFVFTHIHGLTWKDVCTAPTFADLWPEVRRKLRTVDFLAAHNAPFDRRVLSGCCDHYHLPAIHVPFVCTVQIARQVWNIHPTTLPDVCSRLRIPLRHHQADSDAEACARIVVAAAATGWSPDGRVAHGSARRR
ncbi:MAG: 3'-5' exonuclease [Burkholderiales bacterium]